MEYAITIGLALFGAALGSFAGAQVWRLRARQLVEDKKGGRKVDTREYKRLLPLTKQTMLSGRSIDLDTGKQLPWHDLLPIVSWLMLRGRSRFSGKPIGLFELLIEVGMALFFVASYVFWPLPLDNPIEIAKLAMWLAAGVVLAIQFATDCKWQILWTLMNYATIGIGVLYTIVTIFGSADVWQATYSAIGSVTILGGLYIVLYWVSRERWVGLGDAILGLGLGLLLADWTLALIALFIANVIGTVIVLVGIAMKKIQRHQHVPFGPMLIAGAVIAQLAGQAIISWYLAIFLL